MSYEKRDAAFSIYYTRSRDRARHGILAITSDAFNAGWEARKRAEFESYHGAHEGAPRAAGGHANNTGQRSPGAAPSPGGATQTKEQDDDQR